MYIKNKLNNYLIVLFFLYLSFSLLIYKDFGISIDEPSTRFHGLVSFNYIVELLNNFFFLILPRIKIYQIYEIMSTETMVFFLSLYSF